MNKATKSSKLLRLLLVLIITMGIMGSFALFSDNLAFAEPSVKTIEIDSSVNIGTSFNAETITIEGTVYQQIGATENLPGNTADEINKIKSDFILAFRESANVTTNNKYLLTSNFVITAADWYAKDTTFNGELNGNNKQISIASSVATVVPTQNDIGFFDTVSASAKIHKLAFDYSGSIKISQNAVLKIGSFAGVNNGEICNSSFSINGAIEASNDGDKTLGGVIGVNSGKFYDNNVNVSGTSVVKASDDIDNQTAANSKSVGGVIGINSSLEPIQNNIIVSAGSVYVSSEKFADNGTSYTTNAYVGGVVGSATQAISMLDNKITLSGQKSIVIKGNFNSAIAGGVIGFSSGTINLSRNRVYFNSTTIEAKFNPGDGSIAPTTLFAGGVIGKANDNNTTLKSLAIGSMELTLNAEAVNSDPDANNNLFYNTGIIAAGGDFQTTNISDIWVITSCDITPSKDENTENVTYGKKSDFWHADGNVVDGNVSGANQLLFDANINIIKMYGSGVIDIAINPANSQLYFIPVNYEYSTGASPFNGWYSNTEEGTISTDAINIDGVDAYLTTNYAGLNQYKNASVLSPNTDAKMSSVAAVFIHTQIYYQYELTQLAKDTNSGANFKWLNVELMNNLSPETEVKGVVLNNGFVNGMPPIGTKEYPFRGKFNGNNNTITFNEGSLISHEETAGIFGVIGTGAKVYDVNIDFYGKINLTPMWEDGQVFETYTGLSSENQLSAGVLAAVNRGIINNVNVNIGSGSYIGTSKASSNTCDNPLIINIGGAIGLQESNEVSVLNVINYGDMTAALQNSTSVDGNEINMGGAFGKISGGQVRGVAVEFQGVMRSNGVVQGSFIDAAGGLVGRVISENNTKVNISYTGVSIGNHAIFNNSLATFDIGSNNFGFWAGASDTANIVSSVDSSGAADTDYNWISIDKAANDTISIVGGGFTSTIYDVHKILVSNNDTENANSSIVIKVNFEKGSATDTLMQVAGGKLKFTKIDINNMIFGGWFKLYNGAKIAVSEAEGNKGSYFNPYINIPVNTPIYAELISNTIRTKDQLSVISEINMLGNKFSGVTFVLGNDIDIDGGFTPLGNTAEFDGNIDGNGYTVTVTQELGLVNYLGINGSIYGMTYIYNYVQNENTDGYNTVMGAVVSSNKGTLGYAKTENGEITSLSNKKLTIIVRNSLLSGQYVGIVGMNEGKIVNVEISYENSQLIAYNDNAAVGGIAAYNKGLIKTVVVNIDNSTKIIAKANSSGYAGGAVGYNEGGSIDSIAVLYNGSEIVARRPVNNNPNLEAFYNGVFSGYTTEIITRSFVLKDALTEYPVVLEADGTPRTTVGYDQLGNEISVNVILGLDGGENVCVNTIMTFVGDKADIDQDYIDGLKIGTINVTVVGTDLQFTAVENSASTAKPFYKWKVSNDTGSSELTGVHGANGKTYNPSSADLAHSPIGSTIYAYFVKTDIATLDDLNLLASDVNGGYSPNVTYTLSNNIIVDGIFNPIAKFDADETCQYAFNGIFNGNGYTLTIKSAKFSGLFGKIATDGKISNVTILLPYSTNTSIDSLGDVNIGYSKDISLLSQVNDGAIDNVTINIEKSVTASRYFGGVAIINNGEISNVSVNFTNGDIKTIGSTDNKYAIGLITTFNYGKIGEYYETGAYKINVNATSTGLISIEGITGEGYIGGIAAVNHGEIYNAETSISGKLIINDKLGYVGAAVGSNESGIIKKVNATFAAGSVAYAQDGFIGGLVGFNKSAIINATVTIESKLGVYNNNYANSTGGAVGVSTSSEDVTYLSTISGVNVIVNKSLYAVSNVGGLIGMTYANFTSTPNDGDKNIIVNCEVITNASLYSTSFAGGVIGNNEADVDNVIATIGGSIISNIDNGSAGGFAGSHAALNANARIKNSIIHLQGIVVGKNIGSILGKTIGSVTLEGNTNNITVGDNTWVIMRNSQAIDTSNIERDGFNALKIVGTQSISVSKNTSGIPVFTYKDAANFYSWYSDVAAGDKIIPNTANDYGVVSTTNRSFTPSENISNINIHISFHDLDIDGNVNGVIDTNASGAQLLKNAKNEFAALARAINNNDYFYGVKISLYRDLIYTSTDTPFIPLGTEGNPFNAIFEGNDKTITFSSGSSISSVDYSGIFGYVVSNSTISNLKVDIEEGVNVGGSTTTYSGVFVGKGAGQYRNIAINAHSVPKVSTEADRHIGAFAGSLEDLSGVKAIAENVWIIVHNDSIPTVYGEVVATNAQNGHLEADTCGVNRLSLIGNGDVTVSLSQKTIRIYVIKDDGNENNSRFYGWLSNATDNTIMDETCGEVVSDPALDLMFVPDSSYNEINNKYEGLSNKVFTLSFIKLSINNVNDYLNFVDNVNIYEIDNQVQFNLTNDITIIGGVTKESDDESANVITSINPIGKSTHMFNSKFNGNGHKITFNNVTFTGGFSGMFGYVGERGEIRNLQVETNGNTYGTGTSPNYAAPFIAYFAGNLLENIVVKAGDDNKYNAITNSTFIGTVNTARSEAFVNAWLIKSQFNETAEIGNTIAVANYFNVIKTVGEGTITSSIHDDIVEFTFSTIYDGYTAHIFDNDFVDTPVTQYIPNKTDKSLVKTNLFVKKSIENEADLRKLSDNINLGINYTGITYNLMSDIVLSGSEFTPIGGMVDTRYDGKRSYFSGKFNGNGHSITIPKTVSINTNYSALFGMISQNAEICDLIVNINTTIGGNDTLLAAGLVADFEFVDDEKAPSIILDGTTLKNNQLNNIILNCAQWFSLNGSTNRARVANVNADFIQAIIDSAIKSGTATAGNSYDVSLASSIVAINYNSKQNHDIYDAELEEVNLISVLGNGSVVASFDDSLNIVVESLGGYTTDENGANVIDSTVTPVWYSSFGYNSDNLVSYSDNIDIGTINWNTASGLKLGAVYIVMEISNLDDLVKLSTDTNMAFDSYGVKFTMTSDIVVDCNIRPIGMKESPFSAIFDGQGKSIILTGGIVIDDDNYAGLFGYIAKSGIVKNLKVICDDVKIGHGAIINEAGKTIVYGTKFAGVIAYNEGTIDTLIIDAYGLHMDDKLILGVDEYHINSGYQAAGIGMSKSLNITNSWVIVTTKNPLEAMYLENVLGQNRMNKILVIGSGTLESTLFKAQESDDFYSVKFSEKVPEASSKKYHIFRSTESRLLGWYTNFNMNTPVKKDDSAIGTFGGVGLDDYTFVPNRISTDCNYEVALVYLTILEVADINAIAYDCNNGNFTYSGRIFKLGANLTINDGENIAIGTDESYFKGTFNGAGNTITMTSSSVHSSMFSPIFNVNYGAIYDLKIVINGGDENNRLEYNYKSNKNSRTSVGLLANNNYGSIENVSVEIGKNVLVNATDVDNKTYNIGTLVGINQSSGEIVNTTVDIKGHVIAGMTENYGNVGGVVSDNIGVIDGVKISITGLLFGKYVGGVVANNIHRVTNVVLKMYDTDITDENSKVNIKHQLDNGGVLTADEYVGSIVGFSEGSIANVVSFVYKGNIMSSNSNKAGALAGKNDLKMNNTWAVFLAVDDNILDLAGSGNIKANILSIKGEGIIDATIDNGKILFANVLVYKGITLNKKIHGWYNANLDNISLDPQYGSISSSNDDSDYNSSYLPNPDRELTYVSVQFVQKEISTMDDLINLSVFVNSGLTGNNTEFKLNNDIVVDLTDPVKAASFEDFRSIGTETSPFNYVFNGQNKTITFIGNRSNIKGLFGYTGIDSSIINLNILIRGSVGSDTDEFVGGLVYYNNGSIENSVVTIADGSINGIEVGGMAVTNNGRIVNSSVNLAKYVSGSINTFGKIIAQKNAAGFVVYNTGNIIDCNVNNGGLISANDTLNVYSETNVAGMVYKNSGLLNRSNVEFKYTFVSGVDRFTNSGLLTSSSNSVAYAAGYVVKNSAAITNSKLTIDADLYNGTYAISTSRANLSHISGFVISNNNDIKNVLVDVNTSLLSGGTTVARIDSILLANTSSRPIDNVWTVIYNKKDACSVEEVNNFYNNNTPAVEYLSEYKVIKDASGNYLFEFIANESTKTYVVFTDSNIDDGGYAKTLTLEDGVQETNLLKYCPTTDKGRLVSIAYKNTISTANDYYMFVKYVNAKLESMSITINNDITLDSAKLEPVTQLVELGINGNGNNVYSNTLTIAGDADTSFRLFDVFKGSIKNLIIRVEAKVANDKQLGLIGTLNSGFIERVALVLSKNCLLDNTMDMGLNFFVYDPTGIVSDSFRVCALVIDENSAYNDVNATIVRPQATTYMQHYLVLNGIDTVDVAMHNAENQSTVSDFFYIIKNKYLTDNGLAFVGYYDFSMDSLYAYTDRIPEDGAGNLLFDGNSTGPTGIRLDFIDLVIDSSNATTFNDRYNKLAEYYGTEGKLANVVNVWVVDDVNITIPAEESAAYDISKLLYLDGFEPERVYTNITDVRIDVNFVGVFDGNIELGSVRYKQNNVESVIIPNNNIYKLSIRYVDAPVNTEFVFQKTLITSAEDLKHLIATVASGFSYSGETIRLGANITVDSTFGSLGTATTCFQGIFDGNGMVITLTSDNYLFGVLGNKIINLKILSNESVANIVESFDEESLVNNNVNKTNIFENVLVYVKGAIGGDFVVVTNALGAKVSTSNPYFVASANGMDTVKYTVSHNTIADVTEWNLFADSFRTLDYNNKVIKIINNITESTAGELKTIGYPYQFKGRLDGSAVSGNATITLSGIVDGTPKYLIENMTYLLENINFVYTTMSMPLIKTCSGTIANVTLTSSNAVENNAFVIWYDESIKLGTNEAEVKDAYINHTKITISASLNNLYYRMVINSITNAKELLLFADTTKQTPAANYLGGSITIANDIELKGEDIGDRINLLNGFAGTLVGDYKGTGAQIVISFSDIADTFETVFNSCADAHLSNIIFRFDSSADTHTGLVSKNGSITIDNNVSYLSMDYGTATEGTTLTGEIKRINILGYDKIVFEVIEGVRYGVLMPYRNTAALNSGVYMPVGTAADKVVLNGVWTSQLYGITVNNYKYDLTTVGTNTLEYELKYIVSAKSGDIVKKVFGLFQDGDEVVIDVNVNELIDEVLIDENVTYDADKVKYVVNAKDYELLFTKITLKTRVVTYNASTQPYSESEIRQELNLSADYDIEFNYRTADTLTSITSPMNAAVYLVSVNMYKNNVLVGRSGTQNYKILPASLYSSFSIDKLEYNGSNIVPVSKINAITSFIGLDKPAGVKLPTLYYVSADKSLADSDAETGKYIWVREQDRNGEYVKIEGTDNYSLHVDSEGYLMFNGKRVLADITKKTIAFNAKLNDIVFMYDYFALDRINEVIKPDLMNAGTKLATLNVLTDSSQLGNEALYTTLIIDGVEFKVALLITNTAMLKSVGTYVSKFDNDYMQFVCIAPKNYKELAVNTSALKIQVTRRDIYLTFDRSTKTYGDYDPDFEKYVFAHDFIYGLVEDDSIKYNISRNNSEQTITNNNLYNVYVNIIKDGINVFEKDNPNYRVVNKDDSTIVPETVEGKLQIVKRNIEVQTILDYNRLYGISALKNPTVDKTNTYITDDDGNNIKASLWLHKILISVKTPDGLDVVTNTNIPVGTYEFTWKVVDNNGVDCTANYDIINTSGANNYEIKKPEVVISQSSVKVIDRKIIGGIEMAVIEYLVKIVGTDNYILETTASGTTTPKKFTSLVDLPDYNEFTNKFEDVVIDDFSSSDLVLNSTTIVGNTTITPVNVVIDNVTASSIAYGSALSINADTYLDCNLSTNLIADNNIAYGNWKVIGANGTEIDLATIASTTDYTQWLQVGLYSLKTTISMTDNYAVFAGLNGPSDIVFSISEDNKSIVITVPSVIKVDPIHVNIELGVGSITYGDTLTSADISSEAIEGGYKFLVKNAVDNTILNIYDAYGTALDTPAIFDLIGASFDYSKRSIGSDVELGLEKSGDEIITNNVNFIVDNYTSGSLKVSKRKLTIKAVEATYTFTEGDTTNIPEIEYTTTGLVKGDKVTGDLSWEGGANATPGKYTVNEGDIKVSNKNCYVIEYDLAGATVIVESATKALDVLVKVLIVFAILVAVAIIVLLILAIINNNRKQKQRIIEARQERLKALNGETQNEADEQNDNSLNTEEELDVLDFDGDGVGVLGDDKTVSNDNVANEIDSNTNSSADSESKEILSSDELSDELDLDIKDEEQK